MATTLEKQQQQHVGASDTSNVSLTVRLIMQGKEVGSIIGKKGEIVKRFRDESGAKINISDGSCPERIVTVTGHTDSIYKAFTLICNKFEEDLANLVSPNTVPKPPITFRLIVPASQMTQSPQYVTKQNLAACQTAIMTPPITPFLDSQILYIPTNPTDPMTSSTYHQMWSPICGSGQPSVPVIPTQTIPTGGVTGLDGNGSFIPNHFPTDVQYLNVKNSGGYLSPPGNNIPLSSSSTSSNPYAYPQPTNPNLMSPTPLHVTPSDRSVYSSTLSDAGKLGSIQLAGISTLNGLGGFGGSAGALNPAALAALAGQHQQAGRPQTTQQTHEMTVPNELIGCIIGKGGSKIAEIRQLSGAMIRISNCEDRDSIGGGSNTNMDRTITITGNAESVALAQYLINMSIGKRVSNQPFTSTLPSPTGQP